MAKFMFQQVFICTARWIWACCVTGKLGPYKTGPCFARLDSKDRRNPNDFSVGGFILTTTVVMDFAGADYSVDTGGEEGGVTLTEASQPSSSGAGRAFTGANLVDIFLWKRWHVSLGVIVAATVGWIMFERSGLPFLSICSDVLLVLIVVLFLRANYAAYRNKEPNTLPELVVSEEMVNNAAASVRVKINYVLLMAHDITLGKDFRLFFKVASCLWLLSVLGSYLSFFTLSYIGAIISITLPAFYSKYGDHVDKCSGMIHQKISKHYKIVDDTVTSRLPRTSSKDKDM